MIHTLVLRVMTDPRIPSAMRGTLRRVQDSAERSFADEESLLSAVRQLVTGPADTVGASQVPEPRNQPPPPPSDMEG